MSYRGEREGAFSLEKRVELQKGITSLPIKRKRES